MSPLQGPAGNIEFLLHARVGATPLDLPIDEAIAAAKEIGVTPSYLSHLTHLTGHAALEATLPPGIRLAYDGLRLDLTKSGIKIVR